MIIKRDVSELRSRFRAWLLDKPRYYKRTVLVVIDLALLGFALWVWFSVRWGFLYVPPRPETLYLMIAAPVICVATLWRCDVYKVVTRFMGYRGVRQITMALGIGTLLWSLLVLMVGQAGVPRSVILPFWISGAALLILVRYAIKLLLESMNISPPRLRNAVPLKRTVIYGAGQLGARLLADVRKARDREVCGFIDSSPSLWRQYVNGVKVHAPQRLPRLIEREGVSEVLVAIGQRRERRDVLEKLEKLPVTVKILPAYEDITFGRVGVNNLRNVEVGDLLGRDPVTPNATLMAGAIRGKSVLVTGAGGSIGSELVRQMAGQSPRQIVLFEISEPALYKIERELKSALARLPQSSARPVVKTVLGSVLDEKLIRSVIVDNGIETVYHAAAYKHVPIVEANAIVGLNNNTFGTWTLARIARSCGVERFVLISTDKAVRPANIMGASKRLAEMGLQAISAEGTGSTIFTVVRFGNVLDSSGSVVPLFREQIRKGGPITVTHPEVTRYFMSLSESAELVIQAGAMAKGGEVFVLQMGDPVRIDDLARLMVRLSNLEIRDASNPKGDIAISYIGLRPGEKLYEELLIGAHTKPTAHPRIFKSDEPFLTAAELEQKLSDLKRAMIDDDLAAIEVLLARTVEGYQPRSGTPHETEHGDWPVEERRAQQEARTLH